MQFNIALNLGDLTIAQFTELRKNLQKLRLADRKSIFRASDSDGSLYDQLLKLSDVKKAEVRYVGVSGRWPDLVYIVRDATKGKAEIEFKGHTLGATEYTHKQLNEFRKLKNQEKYDQKK